jgi:hypothetical protein
MLDEWRKLFAQFRGILLVQVDLVLRTAYAKPQRLGRRTAIKIVFQRDDYLCCHPNSPVIAMTHIPLRSAVMPQ